MSSSDYTPIPISEASRLAKLSLLSPGPKGLAIETAQAVHRLNLLNAWRIPPASTVLEVGCGQGNCTTLLATVVGPDGHVDAFDPASPDYGAPFTLREAQEHISKGEVGERITWWNRGLAEFLGTEEGKERRWDYVVFCHSLWYFKKPEDVTELLTALKGRVNYLLIAEYALEATHPPALSHVLAARTRALLESLKEESHENIQSLLSPSDIKTLVDDQRCWHLDSEEMIAPGEDLPDGGWEVGTVKDEQFEREIEESVWDEEKRRALKSGRQAVLRALRENDDKVRTMDVWGARA